LKTGTDDGAVFDLDPRPQIVRLAETVGVAEPSQIAGFEAVGRRLVVMADTELERQLRHSLDRLGRHPRTRADRAFYAHSVPPYWPSPRSKRGDHRDPRRGSGGWSGPPAAAWTNDLQDSQVLLHLPVGQLDAVLVPLLPLQLDVPVEDVRAERLAHE